MPDPIQSLAEEFRHHLETFYARLKLAPPYDSVEKAVCTLTATVRTLPADQQRRILSDPVARWEQFRSAFEESGLVKKHRGIIAGLVRNRASLDLPEEYDRFLNLFVA
ncbi:MAG: hypothetical protein NZM29_02400 [Nitrospira sp.]|nr:hypothetical protein [Nitrospira sp.]